MKILLNFCYQIYWHSIVIITFMTPFKNVISTLPPYVFKLFTFLFPSLFLIFPFNLHHYHLHHQSYLRNLHHCSRRWRLLSILFCLFGSLFVLFNFANIYLQVLACQEHLVDLLLVLERLVLNVYLQEFDWRYLICLLP